MTKTVDVVAGQNTLAAWGNEIRDRTIQVFATTTERDSAYPIPNRGQCCYVASNDLNEGFWTYDGTAWRPPWNTAWGYWAGLIDTSANYTGVVAEQDVTASSVSWTPVPNRRYQVDIQARVATTGSAFEESAILALTDMSNSWVFVAEGLAGVSTSWPNRIASKRVYTASLGSTPLQWKLRGKRNVGTNTMAFTGSSITPMLIEIRDIGPLTGAPS